MSPMHMYRQNKHILRFGSPLGCAERPSTSGYGSRRHIADPAKAARLTQIPRFDEDRRGMSCRGTDNFAAGLNSRQSTMGDFNATAVVTTYLNVLVRLRRKLRLPHSLRILIKNGKN
jgi:hypothetical protein